MGRRIETTDYLKECIANSLIELMSEKPIGKISIQELTEHAKVGRTTYFRYFNSKTDVIVYKLLLLWEAHALETPFPEIAGDYEKAFWFFSFCEGIKDTLKILYDASEINALLYAFLEFTKPMIVSDESRDMKYKRLFTSYGLFGIVSEWIVDGFTDSADELAGLCIND